MSYQVIARKWRPQSFDELIGQFHISNTLKNAIKNDRVGHAFLFTGVRGVGKTTTARILAKRLNCENPKGGNPCNVCASCQDVQKGKHIDIVEIDGASNTGVDDVKVLREAAKYLPSRGQYKVYIIDEVHMLSEKAFNALLKTLEEPPPHVKFIFATTDPHKIPITIKSRCQIYDFRAIALDEIFKQLCLILDAEGIKYEEQALFLIAKKAEGSMRDAQSLLEQVVSFASNNITKLDVLNILGVTDSDSLFEMSTAVLNHDVETIILNIGRLMKSGINLVHYYKELIEHFHHIMIARSVKSPHKVLKMPTFEVERYLEHSKAFDQSFIKLYELLIEGFDKLKSSQFQQITFEMNMIKLAEFRPVTPLKDILKFVNKLSNTFNEQPEAKKIEVDLFGMLRGSKLKEVDMQRVTKTESQMIEKKEVVEESVKSETPSFEQSEAKKIRKEIENNVVQEPAKEFNKEIKTEAKIEVKEEIKTEIIEKPTEQAEQVLTIKESHEFIDQLAEQVANQAKQANQKPMAQIDEVELIEEIEPKEKIALPVEQIEVPEVIDYTMYKKMVEPFFLEEDLSYHYFYKQVKLPVLYQNQTLTLEYSTNAEVMFNLHPNFVKLYESWLKKRISKDLKLEIKMGDVNQSNNFEGIEERARKEADQREIDAIRNLDGVKRLEETFQLKVKKIIRSKDGKSKDKKEE